MFTEAIATTLDEALILEQFGINRIELITGAKEGGLTPSLGLIEEVTTRCRIPVNVMLRTKEDFELTDNDLAVMLKDLALIKQTQANGIVFGALKNGKINRKMIQTVFENKGHLSMTLHRCFDYCNDLEDAIDFINELKIERLLTSGHEESVIDGAKNLAEIRSKLPHTIVMAGAGLTIENLESFIREHRPQEIHIGSTTHVDGNWTKPIDIERLKYIQSIIQRDSF